MFDRLGEFVSRHWLPVIITWVLVAAALHAIAPRWNEVTHDGDLAYLPDSVPSALGQRLLAEAFPNQHAKSQIAIVVERPSRGLTKSDLLWSDSLAGRFRVLDEELPIVDVWNRNSEIVGERLTSRVSKLGQATVTLLHIRNEFMATENVALVNSVQRIVDDARQTVPVGLSAGITGSAAVGGDMIRSATESIQNTERTTVLLVIVILLIVYQAPLLVSIPLITIGTALFVSIDVLALMTQLSRAPGFSWWNFKIFTTSKIFIVVILFGAGTDFCLFLISRYKEELERGLTRTTAVRESVGRVGEALVGSAMTTICGLGMMFFADFGKFRNSGPGIALCLAITLIACLSLAPALLAASGRAVFWPFGIQLRQPQRTAEVSSGASRSSWFWNWAASEIVRRPALILVASVVVLMPIAYQGWFVPTTYDFLNELDSDCPSVLGTALAKRHFPAGEMSPITILAFQDNGHFDTAEGETEIARLTKVLHDIDGVESVRSIVEPLGDRPGYFQPFRARGLNKLAARKHKQTKANYLTQVPGLLGKVARFDLVLHDGPFSLEAIEVLNRIEGRLAQLRNDHGSPWRGGDFAFVGTTVGIRDLASVTTSDQRRIEQLVVLAVLVVLLVLLRRPVVCVYLIVSVLFSYFVTLGISDLFFRWLYGDTFYGLDWKVPIFLFVILIAIGEDYNIYLVTRILEEQRRLGPLAGLRNAVAKTGGIITSCGVIMAGTFISMASGNLRGMSELGFALSLGVMLDTCVVRPILVPAFLVLLDRSRSSSLSVEDGEPPAGQETPSETIARS